MIKHILKDGREVTMVTGYQVNQDKTTEIYRLAKEINTWPAGEDYDNRSKNQNRHEE